MTNSTVEEPRCKVSGYTDCTYKVPRGIQGERRKKNTANGFPRDIHDREAESLFGKYVKE